MESTPRSYGSAGEGLYLRKIRRHWELEIPFTAFLAIFVPTPHVRIDISDLEAIRFKSGI